MDSKPRSESFRDDFVVEFLGEEIAILDTRRGLVHRLPASYRDTVRAMMLGDAVADQEQLDDLVSRGVLPASNQTGLSRRSLIAGAGMVGAGFATLGLPVSAYASSETFTMGNLLFTWSVPDGPYDDDNPFGAVIGSFPLVAPYPDIIKPGDVWTLTVTIGQATLSASSPPDTGTNLLQLTFFFPDVAPTAGALLFGRLSGPSGQLSNLFEIREASAG
jgi:hypothetical protein